MTRSPVAVVGLAVLLAACGPGDSAAANSPSPAPVVKDPMTDAAAWKALPAAERAKLAARVVADTNFREAASVSKAHAFLAERGEDAAAADVVKRRLATDPDCAWARGVCGEFEIRAKSELCLAECELAEAENLPPVVELRALAGGGDGPKWVDAAAARKADELIASIRAYEARVSTAYGAGMEKWVKWQRGFPVMSSLPEVHDSLGRHLVFVSMGGGAKRTSEETTAAARIVLERYKACVAELEAAWRRDIAEPLGLDTYPGESASEKTILKVNVFTEMTDYANYQFESRSWESAFTSAHYVAAEPRFLAALHPDSPDEWTSARLAFLEEGVRQLVHFHTWDATRKARDRELDWSQCLHRAWWSASGFPRFFAHHTATPNAKRPWLASTFVGQAVAAKRGWRTWSIEELFSLKDEAEVAAAARKRGGEASVALLTELFESRAAGLAEFLWNADDAGAPKHRANYLKFLGAEMVVKTRIDHERREVAIRVGLEHAKNQLGLTGEGALAAFSKELDAYEAAAIAAEHDPDWQARVDRILKADADGADGTK